MINISKSGNAIKFAFTDSDHYLYGNGEIEVPVNSLSLIVDESNMVTFRKANSNDIFLSFDPANSNLSDKAGVINFYKTNMVGSTGGGSESGITSGDVQTMIDNSLEDYYTDDEVDAALSGKASVSAVTAVANDVQTVSGQVQTKVATSDFNAYSAATATAIGNKQDALVYYSEDTSNESATINVQTDDGLNKSEKRVFVDGGDIIIESYNETDDGEGNTGTTDTQVDINSLGLSIITYSDDGIDTNQTELKVQPMGAYINSEPIATEPYVDAALSGKADTSAVTAAIDAAISGKVDTSAITTSITSGSTDTEIPSAKAVYDAIPTGGTSATVDATLNSGSTNPVANSAITTAIDNAKAYYISFATIATTGIRDEDWDGIVAAIDDHRPIYAGYPRNNGGILYYGVECMKKNGDNTQIVLTSSDDNSHYFYTFTKNGSNDYTFTSETRPYVTDAEMATWNAKQDALSAGTGIEISGNVISATGGGGMDDDTQQLISTAFNDLNDRKADLTELTKYQKKGDYVETPTLADYMTNDAFDEYATAKERIISGALNDLNDKFGGLRLVKISQTDYDNLATKDENTLYIINNVI